MNAHIRNGPAPGSARSFGTGVGAGAPARAGLPRATAYIHDVTDEVLQELVRRSAGEEPLQSLHAAAELRRHVERMEAVLVRRARVAGASWAQIAEALGVTKQSAHRKFGGGGLLRRDP